MRTTSAHKTVIQLLFCYLQRSCCILTSAGITLGHARFLHFVACAAGTELIIWRSILHTVLNAKYIHSLPRVRALACEKQNDRRDRQVGEKWMLPKFPSCIMKASPSFWFLETWIYASSEAFLALLLSRRIRDILYQQSSHLTLTNCKKN